MALQKTVTLIYNTTVDNPVAKIPLCPGSFFGSGNLRVKIAWGDGETDEIVDTNALEQGRSIFHRYSTTGDHWVTIYGGYGDIDGERKLAFNKGDQRGENDLLNFKVLKTHEHFYMHGQGDFLNAKKMTFIAGANNLKILKSANPDNIALTNTGTYYLNDTFAGCEVFEGTGIVNLFNTTDCTKMSGTFRNTLKFKGYIKGWDTQNVTDMSSMFEGSSFNQSIADWNVDNVVTTANMFKDTTAFNQWIAPWFEGGVKQIQDMSGMFEGSIFNNKLAGWNMQSVKNTANMFKNSKFNLFIGNWFKPGAGKSFVIEDMSGMFEGSDFTGGLASWDMQTVKTISGMFRNNNKFNGYIDSWFKPGAGKSFVIEDISGLFEENTAFTDKIPSWDLRTVKNASNVFKNNTTYPNHWLNGWFQKKANKVYSLENISGMFEGSSWNNKISDWDLSKVKDISYLFKNKSTWTQWVDNLFPASNVVEHMDGMFEGASINPKCTSWKFNNIKTANDVFKNSTVFNQYIEGWFKNSTQLESTSGMFEGSSWNGGLNQWNMSSVKDVSNMFKDNTAFDGYIEGWFSGTGHVVENMSGMFEGSAYNGKLAGWKLHSSVKNIDNMFKDTTTFNKYIEGWFTAANVLESAAGTFENAAAYNQKTTGWNMSNIKNVSGMFKNNTTFTGYIEPWFNQSNVVEDLSSMFEGSTYNNKLVEWKLPAAKSTSNMFKDASFDGYIQSWFKYDADTTYVIEDMSGMFSGSSAYGTNANTSKAVNQWDVRSVKDASSMFEGNDNFGAWMKNWNYQGKNHGFESIQSYKNFSTKANWAGAPWLPNDRAETLTGETEKTLNVASDESVTGKVTIVAADGIGNLTYSETTTDTPGSIYVTAQPTGGTVSLSANGVDTFNWIYDISYSTYVIGDDTFTVTLVDSNGKKTTFEPLKVIVGKSNPGDVSDQPEPPAPPAQVEARWHDVQVTRDGESVDTKVLQLKNLIQPTNESFTNQTSEWWTVYGYTGDHTMINLDGAFWADAGVIDTYGDTHSTTITLPDDAGTIEFTAHSSNDGYLQATLTLADGYKFDDDQAHGGLVPQTAHLFLTMADINSDSAQLLGTYPLAMKTVDSGGGGAFEPEPGDGVTGTGYMTGDLALIVKAGDTFSGNFQGEIEFHDDTYGANHANGYDADNMGIILYEHPGEWGSMSFSYSTDTYKWRYNGYINDTEFRGDKEFTITWANDRSADLIQQDYNGEIEGANASYSDPANGVVGTVDEMGSEYNFTITADGSTSIGELVESAGYFVSWDWYEGKMHEEMGWPTHVYPNGTEIAFTGGKANYLEQGTEDYTIAYEQNNTQKIKIRFEDATDSGPGTLGGDVDMSMVWMDGQISGQLTFQDPDGVDGISDPMIGGWYSAGSNAKPGTTARGSLQLRQNSIDEAGQYDYYPDTMPENEYPYVDEFQITWYDDAGFLNTGEIKITVSAPTDQAGNFSGQTSFDVDGIADPTSWSPGQNSVNGTLTLNDLDQVTWNDPVITANATLGTFSIDSKDVNGDTGTISWSYAPYETTTGPGTDNVTIEWGDVLENKTHVDLTFNIIDTSSGGGGGGEPSGQYTGATGDVTAWNSMNGDMGDNSYVTNSLVFEDYPSSDWFITDASYAYPGKGSFSWTNGTFDWSYSVNDASMGGPSEQTTDEFEVTYNLMNFMGTGEVASVTVNHVINIAAPTGGGSGGGGGGGGADQPGTTGGDVTLSVGSNSQDNPNGNTVSGYLTYADPDGIMMNYGSPDGIATPPSKGVASLNYSMLTYTPNPDAQGTDQFTIFWTDDLGNTNEQVINVTIIDMSDKPITSSGDKTINAEAPPATQHMSDMNTYRATGTITINDENGLPPDTSSYQLNPGASSAADGYWEVVSVTSVSQNQVTLVWGYTPGPAEAPGEKKFELHVYDDGGYTSIIELTANVTQPTVGGLTEIGTPTQLAVTASKNNNSTVSYANGQGPTMVVYETPHGEPTVQVPAGYLASITQGGTLNQYEVTIDLDPNHTFTPVDPMVPITTNVIATFNDGYGRLIGTRSVNVQINAYVDVPGTLTLKDAYGTGDFTDEYGQSLATDSQDEQTVTLYKPAPMSEGLIMVGELDDIDGYDISTVTVINNTANVDVISGPVDGQFRLELTAQANSTSGSIDIRWTDLLNNVYTKTVNIEIEDLPNLPGVLHGVYDDEGNKLNQNTDNDWIAEGNSADAVSVTIQVQDVNDVGAVSITGQPATGTATVVETGGGYMVTYTPPASPTIWPTADVEVTWFDAAGNQNDPVVIQFFRGSDVPGGSEGSLPTFGYLFNSDFDTYLESADSRYMNESDTATYKLMIYNSEGFPVDNNTVTYGQPDFIKEGEGSYSSAGVLTITENNVVSVPANLQDIFGGTLPQAMQNNTPVAAKDVTGDDRYTVRIFDVTFTATDDIGTGEETATLYGSIGFQSYWFADQDAIKVEGINFGLGRILGDPVDSLVLEYSDENINIAHLPDHDGTATVDGYTVTISGLSRYGGGILGDADKLALQNKLKRVRSFGNFNNMNWNRAFQNASQLNQVPIVMQGKPISMQSMFEGCTSLTLVNADNWDMSNVTDISRMFYGCTSLNKLYARWDTSSLTSMAGVFAYTGFTSLSDIVGLFPNSPSGWDLSGVSSLAGMFQGSSLTHFTWESTQDTSNITDFSNMFAGATGLLTVDLTNLDTSSATNMNGMFDGCTSLATVNATNLDVSGVTDVKSMFKDTNSLTDLTGMTNANFATATSSSFTDMFKGSALAVDGPNIGGWQIPNVSELPSDIAGAGADISGWTIPVSLDPDAVPLSHTLKTETSGWDMPGVPTNGIRLYIDNYINPEVMEQQGQYYDWRGTRNRYGAGTGEALPGSYFVMKVTLGGEEYEFLLKSYSGVGAHFGLGSYGAQKAYLLPATSVDMYDNRGNWGEVVLEKEYSQTNVFAQSKPSWVTTNMLDDVDVTGMTDQQEKRDKLSLNNSIWLGLNTPTRSQLNSALPSSGDDNVSITIEARSVRAADEDITVVEGTLTAAQLLEYLQQGQMQTNSFWFSVNWSDANVITIPARYGRIHPGIAVGGNAGYNGEYFQQYAANAPERNEETIADWLAGTYDNAETTVTHDPITVILEMVDPDRRMFFSTLGELLESPFIPELSIAYNNKLISVDSIIPTLKNVPTPTKQYLTGYFGSSNFANTVNKENYMDAATGDYRYLLRPQVASEMKAYMNNLIKSGGSLFPESERFVANEADEDMQFNFTSKYATYNKVRKMKGTVFTFDGFRTVHEAQHPYSTAGQTYVEYTWTSTDKAFIESNNIFRAPYTYYNASEFVYDFDPDGVHGLSDSERYLVYMNGAPVNVPTNLKAIPLQKRTSLAHEMINSQIHEEYDVLKYTGSELIYAIGGKYTMPEDPNNDTVARTIKTQPNAWVQSDTEPGVYELDLHFSLDVMQNHTPELSNSVDMNNTDGDNGPAIPGVSYTMQGNNTMIIRLDTSEYRGNPYLFLKCGKGHPNMGSKFWIDLPPQSILDYYSQVEDVPGTETSHQAYVSQYGFMGVHDAMTKENGDGPITSFYGEKNYYGNVKFKDGDAVSYAAATGGQLYYVYPDGEQKARKVRLYVPQQTLNTPYWAPMNNIYGDYCSSFAQSVDNTAYSNGNRHRSYIYQEDELTWARNLQPARRWACGKYNYSVLTTGLWYNYRSDKIDVSNYPYTSGPASGIFTGYTAIFIGQDEQDRIIE